MSRERSSSAGVGAVRATQARIDLDVLHANVSKIASRVAPRQLWAVVKANAYGHGAVACARTALSGGAAGLCVALTQEAVELRTSGITAPIMVLSEQPIGDVPVLVEHDVTCVVYNEHYIAALASQAQAQQRYARVHLKVDTGMHRVGVAPADVESRASTIVAAAWLELEGVLTHLATADEPGHEAITRQIAAFETALSQVRRIAPHLRHVHVANSAAALSDLYPQATMTRVGIALYGLRPSDAFAGNMSGIEPVLSLRTEVSHVQRLQAGEGISYGLRSRLECDTTIATLPIGYADGIPRRAWSTDARILVGGVPRRIVGAVTMDQLMVDCGDDDVHIGDEAVIFGEQTSTRHGSTRVRVDDWARALDTISYEIVCGLSARIPRTYLGGV